MAKQKLDLNDIAGFRKKAGKNQSQFWSMYGITQSGGSRYESGRGLPRPVAILLTLHAGGKLSDDDLAAALTAVKKAHKAP